MTPEEFKAQGHSAPLKAFLDGPNGKALLEVIENHGKPSSESRKQYGSAEDVKLQMSLNYVAMEATFDVVNLIKSLIKPTSNRAPKAVVPGLIDEDASPETLKQLGIEVPKAIDYRKIHEAKTQESIAS